MKSGAGGNWRRYNERKDLSIVQQISDVSCMSAVGEIDQTAVDMTTADFDDNWGLEVIVQWQPEK